MANYVKQTWTDNNGSFPLSAARMGVIEQGIFDAHFQPAARVFHSGSQSIADSTTSILSFNSERFDTDNIHTGGTPSRLTCNTAGIYQVTVNIEWAGNATGTRELFIRLTAGSIFARTTAEPEAAGSIRQSLSTLIEMAVNDWVTAEVIQTSTVSLNVNAAAGYSPEFMMVRVA